MTEVDPMVLQAMLELAQSAVAQAHAETESVRAELNDVREDMAQVELERDELRGAIVTHRAAINAPHRAGNTYDLALWEAIR